VVTPEGASKTGQNYVLSGEGPRAGDMVVSAPDPVQAGALPGVDTFSRPLQPAWGWQGQSAPQGGLTPAEALTELPQEAMGRTARVEVAARRSIGLAGFGHMGATAQDAGNPDRGGYVDYQPVPYAGREEG